MSDLVADNSGMPNDATIAPKSKQKTREHKQKSSNHSILRSDWRW